MLGALSGILGIYPDAEMYCEKSLNSRRHWRRTQNLINALVSQGKYREADAHYDELIRLNPHDPESYAIMASCFFTWVF